jgi:predicted phosphoribosyltransferase
MRMGTDMFEDRTDAGKKLAAELAPYKGNSDVLILALPRGGVPVAYEVAKALNAPLDLLIVRKLGTPLNEELAMGALGPEGIQVMNEDILRVMDVDPDLIEGVIARETRELNRRNRRYRQGRDFPDVTGKTVILIDDGIATGATLFVAIKVLKTKKPKKIIVAVPVGPRTTCEELKRTVDQVICLSMPPSFYAVGQAYRHFPQTTDAEVQELLAELS